MMIAMLIVVTHDSAIVFFLKRVVNVCKIVASDITLGVAPYLPAQLPIAALRGNVMDFIDNFFIRHDLLYHAWLLFPMIWDVLTWLNSDFIMSDRLFCRAGRNFMRYSEQIRPVSYLKDNVAKIVEDITQSREPLVITQNGVATFVVQDIKSYEEGKEAMALLKLLAMGRKQIESGEFDAAEDVFARMDKEILG